MLSHIYPQEVVVYTILSLNFSVFSINFIMEFIKIRYGRLSSNFIRQL
jgi:hypothetical protein